jgi:hypothetical protein
MGRCRCTDINNANNDLKKLTATADAVGEACQVARLTVAGALTGLCGEVLNGATPLNSALLQNIYSKLEQPIYDGMTSSRDKAQNKIRVLPGEIQSLSREDSAYHEALAAQKSMYLLRRDR